MIFFIKYKFPFLPFRSKTIININNCIILVRAFVINIDYIIKALPSCLNEIIILLSLFTEKITLFHCLQSLLHFAHSLQNPSSHHQLLCPAAPTGVIVGCCVPPHLREQLSAQGCRHSSLLSLVPPRHIAPRRDPYERRQLP